jgi:transposase
LKSTSPTYGTLETEKEKKMQKRVHSREFKLDIVRQVITGQKRPAQACREYGLAESVLSRWRKEYQERGEAAFQSEHPEGTSTQEQRIAELEQFCGQLALENQILKKTLQRLESRSATR